LLERPLLSAQRPRPRAGVFVYGYSRDKCTATIPAIPVIVTGMETDLERLTRDYWRTVRRVRRMAVPPADKAIVLADVQVI